MSHHDFSGIDWDTVRYDDPRLVPGDPYEVAVLGKKMQDIASMIETQAGNLRNLVDGTGWDSDAGRAFQKKVGGTADLLAKSQKRYAAAASALGSSTSGKGWAGELEQLQADAKNILGKLKTAYDEDNANQKKISNAPSSTSASDLKQLHSNKQQTEGDLTTWQNKLGGVLDSRDTQAHNAAQAIRDAIDHDGLKNPPHHWWDGWENLVADIGHWAGVAAAFLGVAALLLSWVPVLGEVLGALAAIASVVALVCDTISAIDGKGTWLDVAIDVVGVLSFGAGRVLGEGAKAAEVAAKGADTLEEARGAVASLRSLGVSSDEAWDVVRSAKGSDIDEALDAISESGKNPVKMLPSLKSVVGKSLNPKVYINAIKASSKESADAAEYFKGLNPMRSLPEIGNSSFKTAALKGGRLYFASQAGPLAAGWGNLASTDEPSNWLTGPDLFNKLHIKTTPGLGANGVPGINGHLTPQGG
ncbi:hypothetical protein K7472_07545 [Streptomyces sp. PTM05]|uniref:Putative T7SS secretion signal domain-containing protein n=1 Tax=Streptantibioticus parmotrematis TaxID=2873249 RepID=A0ABS7QNF5_9ACTN|nr:hypothetical protein [Streptantibioticus parmotrematis]MBY8884697.1 hypothetical protein [Streptantibioticus parmotrematis]